MILDRIFKTIFSSRGASEKALSALDEARHLINLRRTDEAARIIESLPESELASAKALNLIGEVAFYRKEDARAEECFRAALALEPENIEAHFGISKLLFEQGRFQDAVLHAHYAQTHDKANGHYAAHAALCFIAVNDLSQAYWSARRAVALEPMVARYWNDQAIIYRMLGRLEDAEQGFRHALSLDPELSQAGENLASLLSEKESAASPEAGTSNETKGGSACVPDSRDETQILQEIDEAERIFAEKPDDLDNALGLARLQEKIGQAREAIDVLTIALTHHPDSTEIRKLRGMLYKRISHPRKAAVDMLKVLKRFPEDTEMLFSLAEIYSNDGKYDEAIKFADRCVTISDKIEHQITLANLYVSACRYEDAIASYEKLLKAHPEAKSMIDLGYGVALSFLGRFQEAEPYLDQAVQAMPYNADVRFVRSSNNLLLGHYAAGWEDYHYRVYADQRSSIRLLPMPLWQGQPINGKRILLLAEQGLGDQVMFASIVPDLLACKPEQVIIEAHERIAKTLARSFPTCKVIPTKQTSRFDWLKDLPDIDFYLPIAELPRFFRPNADSFPKHHGFLVADPDRVAFWKKRVSEVGTGRKVGISWRGGTERTRQAVRSVKLLDLAPILHMPGLDFVNLQYGKVESEINEATSALGVNIASWPEAIEDLDEFAALISALDLTITVCNTTVHYAGGLNCPVWVMTPKIPGWRYGLSGTTMDWYPSARMFRQPALEDWDSVLNEIVSALEKDVALPEKT